MNMMGKCTERIYERRKNWIAEWIRAFISKQLKKIFLSSSLLCFSISHFPTHLSYSSKHHFAIHSNSFQLSLRTQCALYGLKSETVCSGGRKRARKKHKFSFCAIHSFAVHIYSKFSWKVLQELCQIFILSASSVAIDMQIVIVI